MSDFTNLTSFYPKSQPSSLIMVPSLTNTATIAILYLSIYSGLNSVVNSLTPSPKPTPRSFTRRAVITAAPLVAGGISFLGFPINSQALVPGALPPPPKKKVGGGEKTCKTIDEVSLPGERWSEHGDAPPLYISSKTRRRLLTPLPPSHAVHGAEGEAGEGGCL